MSTPEREEQDRDSGVVVPFRGTPPTDREVIDAELVDDDQHVYQPGEEIELPGQRDPQTLTAQAAPGTAPLAPWQASAPQRRPVVPEWMADRAARRAAERWLASYAGHVTAFHTVRLPLYGWRVAWWVPRGGWRIVHVSVRWVFDTEMHPLRVKAIRAGEADLALKLDRQHAERVRPRVILAGVVLVVLLVGGLAVWLLAPWWAQALAVALPVALAAACGRRPDRPLLDTAVLSPQLRKLSPDIVLRAFVAAGLAKEDHPVSFATPIHRDANGWRVVIDLPYGTTADKAMSRRVDVSSGLDVDERQVFLTRVRGASGSARRVDLWVADEDPLSVPAGPSPLLDARRVNFWTGVPFGVDERGKPVPLCLLWAAMLVGAIPRQGKTFVARLVALGAALDPHVQLRVHDLKGGPDWVPFRHVAHRLFFGDRPDPETGVDPVLALLDGARELLAEVDHRNRTLRTLPASVCPEGKLTEELSRTRAAGMPLILMVIDEVQRAFTHKEYGAELEEVLTDLAKVGPSAGIMLLAATQKPDAKSTPTGFRDQFGVKFALRVTTRDASEAVLGAGAYGEGLDASKLSPDAKGCGLLRGVGDSGSVEGGWTVRTYLADSTDAETVCLRGRGLREAAGTLDGMAAGQVPSATPPAYSAAADTLTVMGTEDKAHSDVLCSRLAERWPDRYAEWQPKQLGAALKPSRVPTRQVWATGLDGQQANRNGVVRAELLAALDKPAGGGPGA